MTILWNKKLIKLSDGSYIAWGLKRKKFFFANRNELKLNCSLIEYYEQREKCEKKVISDYRKKNAELEREISILLSCNSCPDNKGGLLCQKEYEGKCLSQKIQYIKELKEENTELKEKAKEIVTALLNVFVYDLADDEMDSGDIDVKVKAEQFLKENN